MRTRTIRRIVLTGALLGAVLVPATGRAHVGPHHIVGTGYTIGALPATFTIAIVSAPGAARTEWVSKGTVPGTTGYRSNTRFECIVVQSFGYGDHVAYLAAGVTNGTDPWYIKIVDHLVGTDLALLDYYPSGGPCGAGTPDAERYGGVFQVIG